MVIDSATASGPGGRPAAVTASSRTVGEDEDAGTGLSLVIDGVRHLHITTRPVPALKRPAQTLASRLCSDPGPAAPRARPQHMISKEERPLLGMAHCPGPSPP